MEIRPVGAEPFHAGGRKYTDRQTDRQTDRHDEAKTRLSQLRERASYFMFGVTL